MYFSLEEPTNAEVAQGSASPTTTEESSVLLWLTAAGAGVLLLALIIVIAAIVLVFVRRRKNLARKNELALDDGKQVIAGAEDDGNAESASRETGEAVGAELWQRSKELASSVGTCKYQVKKT